MKQFSLEEYLANPSRKIVTRDGRSVRIICIDRRGYTCPIVALVEEEDNKDTVCTFKKDGNWSISGIESKFDLFFAPENHEGWMHIYKHINGHYEGDGIVYNTKEQCEVNQSSCILNHFQYEAIAKIEWEE